MQPVTYKWDRRSWYLPRDEEGNITDEDITKVTPDGSKKENVTASILFKYRIKIINHART